MRESPALSLQECMGRHLLINVSPDSDPRQIVRSFGFGTVGECFSHRPTVPPLTLPCASGSAVHLGIWWTLGAKLTVSLLETRTKSWLRVF